MRNNVYRLPVRLLPEYGPMKGRESDRTESGASGDLSSKDEGAVARALAERIADGDRSAEQELVVRYSRPLLYMLRRRAGDADLAEDLHQDVFRVVIERLRDRGINEPEKLAGFIQSTGRNLLIGEIRRSQRRRTYTDSDAIDASADTVSSTQFSETNDAQEATAVRELLDELRPERDRAILIRFYLQQEDKASICSALDLTDLHFNRVLYRAKKRFRALLESSAHAAAADLISRRDED
ncbi:MAG: sigma-70 family RNA polymerase sigma factor [Pseudomonadota bacterium]